MEYAIHLKGDIVFAIFVAPMAWDATIQTDLLDIDTVECMYRHHSLTDDPDDFLVFLMRWVAALREFVWDIPLTADDHLYIFL